jgi:hypothetical protein
MQNCTFRHKLGDHVLNVLALRHLVQFFQLFQNMTTRLVNNSKIPLRKGAGYNLDLAAVGVIVGLTSLFGLPWMVASAVPSLNHVRSLVTLSKSMHIRFNLLIPVSESDFFQMEKFTADLIM